MANVESDPEPESVRAAPPSADPLRNRHWIDVAGRFAFELTAITAGVLIALGINSIAERNRERALVDQARGAIRQELTGNLKELESLAQIKEKQRNQLDNALRFANEMLARGTTDVTEFSFGFSFPSLNAAAWQTADRTGALAYMNYDEVKTYSEVYDLQTVVLETQRQALAGAGGLFSLLAASNGDPTKASRHDIEVFRARLLDVYSAGETYWSLAEQLGRRYRELLSSSVPRS